MSFLNFIWRHFLFTLFDLVSLHLTLYCFILCNFFLNRKTGKDVHWRRFVEERRNCNNIRTKWVRWILWTSSNHQTVSSKIPKWNIRTHADGIPQVSWLFVLCQFWFSNNYLDLTKVDWSIAFKTFISSNFKFYNISCIMLLGMEGKVCPSAHTSFHQNFFLEFPTVGLNRR